MTQASASNPIIDPAVLDVLLSAEGPMGVEAVALRCGLSVKQAMAELARLRAAGCELDEHPQHGVTLTEAGLSTWQDYLAWRLGAGRHVAVYRQTGSTQDVCRGLIAAYGRSADGALVVAEQQSAGRGRLGRRWVAPAGAGLAFSRVYVGDDEATVDRLMFATAVAVAEALERALGGKAAVGIKWPNDVCVDGRKLAGVLVEAEPTAAVIGVGVNTHLQADDLPSDEPTLRERVTSLAMLGVRTHRLAVLAAVVLAIDEALQRTPVSVLLERWRQRCTMLHQRVSLLSDGRPVTGQVLDLDAHAGLIVRRDTGEIVHLPAATTTVV
ncbi:biotin--[acetyl-CoA-carboxylase] ligase [Phycisphaerales bacterium AB-hyl4]|uniref:biotin--[biotin carboxyl-carrier protein] ligase n=1 Tax=Natronomicrosphaera hydrolytica TaxID=3242702 RepID=A0ABV4U9X6_9BACT